MIRDSQRHGVCRTHASYITFPVLILTGTAIILGGITPLLGVLASNYSPPGPQVPKITEFSYERDLRLLVSVSQRLSILGKSKGVVFHQPEQRQGLEYKYNSRIITLLLESLTFYLEGCIVQITGPRIIQFENREGLRDTRR